MLEVDGVIAAIGNSPNPLIRSTTPGLEANRRGCLVVDEDTLRTTREGVYAGGDAVTGAATVILAMGAGKQAARSIDEFIRRKGFSRGVKVAILGKFSDRVCRFLQFP